MFCLDLEGQFYSSSLCLGRKSAVAGGTSRNKCIIGRGGGSGDGQGAAVGIDDEGGHMGREAAITHLRCAAVCGEATW